MSDNMFFKLTRCKLRGKDSIIGRTVRIRHPDLFSIGMNSIIDDFTYVSSQLQVGNFTHVGAGAHIIGGKKAKVFIGDFVNIAPGVSMAAGQNDYYGGDLVGPAIPEQYGGLAILDSIEIADHCLLGFNVVILAGVKLPEGVAVGANSLLKSNIRYKPWTVYAGNPLRELGPRAGKRIKAQADKLIKDVEEGRL